MEEGEARPLTLIIPEASQKEKLWTKNQAAVKILFFYWVTGLLPIPTLCKAQDTTTKIELFSHGQS